MDPSELRRAFEYTFEQMQLVDQPTVLHLSLWWDPDVASGCVKVRHEVQDLISEDLVAAGAIFLLPATVLTHLHGLFDEWLISNHRACPVTPERSSPF